MTVEFFQPTNRDIWWAVGEEFKLLPAVDPAFAPHNLGLLRKLLLRYVVLPLGYRQCPIKIIARQDGKRCGFVFSRLRSGALHIDSLAVLPEFQRQGLGTALIAQTEQLARQQEFDFFTAAVAAGNAPALGLLAKTGFRPYRREHWVRAGGELHSQEDAAWSIREYTPTEILPAYERWQKKAVAKKDAWAAELILGEYARLNWRAAARHWACLAEGEEVGYLRIAGLRGDFAAYLAIDPAWWDSPAQAAWLKLALQTYPSQPSSISVGLAADAQFETSRAAWEGAGFAARPRERFLCIKPLEDQTQP